MDEEINTNLLYPELSYQIVGILFSVYNEMGFGYQEKYYQKAISSKFKELNIIFREQFPVKISFDNNEIGKYFLDFIIEDKVILEIKKLDKFLRKDIEQTYAYLKATDKKLGILANFTKRGLQFKRIVNIRNS